MKILLLQGLFTSREHTRKVIKQEKVNRKLLPVSEEHLEGS